jgi:hypothetical protein
MQEIENEEKKENRLTKKNFFHEIKIDYEVSSWFIFRSLSFKFVFSRQFQIMHH